MQLTLIFIRVAKVEVFCIRIRHLPLFLYPKRAAHMHVNFFYWKFILAVIKSCFKKKQRYIF